MCALLNTATGRKHDSTGRGRGGGLSIVPPLFFDAVCSKKPPSKRGGDDDGPFVLESLFIRRFPMMIFFSNRKTKRTRSRATHFSLLFEKKTLRTIKERTTRRRRAKTVLFWHLFFSLNDDDLSFKVYRRRRRRRRKNLEDFRAHSSRTRGSKDDDEMGV